MSLQDHLLIASVNLDDATYDPIDIHKLKMATLKFIKLLQESEIPERALKHLTNINANLRTPLRSGFEKEYEKEFLKAAFFVQGIYKATHD